MRFLRIVIRIPLKIALLLNKHLGFLRKRFSSKTILILGDSHVEVFNCPLFVLNYPKIYFDVVAVPAATVSGLSNPKSKTQARAIFRSTLQERNYDMVLFCLGEVDTGFLIWYRAQKKDVSVDEALEKAVKNYCSLIQGAIARDGKIVLSAPLPTIEDGRQWGKVADLRKEVFASQLERTKLTLEFNARVDNFCQVNGIQFVGLDRESIGVDGVVRQELKNLSRYDHHYDKMAYSRMIISHLRDYL